MREIPVQLFERYLQGDCTLAEEALIREWYQSFEPHPDYVSDLGDSQKAQLQEEIYNRILNNIRLHKAQPEGSPVKLRYLKKWYSIAAVAAMLLFVIYFAARNNPYINPKTAQSGHVIANNEQDYTITNHTRRLYKFKLPDGSTVWLSPNAVIRYPKTFGPDYRMITMTGKSFFEVTKNPKRPFIIRSNSIITKVWGTSFCVRDMPNSRSAEVSVLTGKVSVSIKNNIKPAITLQKNEILLFPRQKATYLSAQNVLKKEVEKKDKSSIQLWNRVNLSFDNTTLKDIISILNTKYNVHITASEKINHYVLSADFTDFNLPDVLQVLKKTMNIDYELENENDTEITLE
jgi:transmembrane sensor